MKRLVLVCLVVGLASVLPAAAEQSEADQAATMEAWIKAAEPGEVHAFLAKRAGKWDVTGKMWLQPGAEPMESTSTAEAERVLGGRFLMEKIVGTSLAGPFEGLSILGCDNTTGVATNIWYDTMGTMLDVASGQEMAYRTVTTFKDDDHLVFEYYMTPPGAEEVLTMVRDYTRAD
ncbi:MAG: DUF1579 domain-containing protein [bacterium]|nr:DUF1579 domain-containing protein [bacterium]